ncbi:hypothetical protein MMC20_007611 [Loxospora ochrophaea]|nr:hypothetical protein [Loxospora ochrophaea]
MDQMLEGLNAAQRNAATSPASVLQIIAPPGSGKTKTLTSRVAYLLSEFGFKPWNILCLTFTIKSSREMRERIARLIGNGMEAKLILGTFHSVCRRYLVTYGHLIGIQRGFGIADSSDSLGIINRIVKRLKLNIDPKTARSRISSSKARGIGYEELALEATKQKNLDKQEFVTVFKEYELRLRTSNLLDYDDLLLRCVGLLNQYPECASNVEVVLIDEFQDTNLVQFDLMRLFAAKNKRVTSVGDPDQSIYGWRSAEVRNLKRMQKHFPDTLVVHLENNYRSSGAILLAALEVIQQDESRPAKPLLPTHCPGTMPVLRRLPSSAIEASWIVTEVKRSMGMTGNLLNCSDIAILLRSAALSRQIESAMGRAGIPYRMVGGLRFFDRVEIKLLLDYLRVVSQTENNDALARIINVPSRRIGDATIRAILEEAEARKVSLWRFITQIVQGHVTPKAKITKPTEQGISSLMNIILTSKKLLQSERFCSPEKLLEHVIKKIGFKEYLSRTYSEDHETRWANVEELVAQASDCSLHILEAEGEDEDSLPQIQGLIREPENKAEEALSRFLANVALSTELQKDDENDGENQTQERVTISTIHAAKGLEWPVVFIPSVYQGSIPHSRAEDTDEERRLLYVAMTRAQALLYMSCPIKDSMREETTISPFLSSKLVGQYLVDRGPSFDVDTVYDISCILHRPNPTEEQLLAVGQTVENVEDNLWPLNNEKDLEVVEAKWNGTDTARYPLANQHVIKRRRVGNNGEQGWETQYPGDIPASNGSAFSLVSSKITMLNSSSFSIPAPSCGFFPAASQLQNEKENTRPTRDTKFEDKGQKTSFSGNVAQGRLDQFWISKTNRSTGSSGLRSKADLKGAKSPVRILEEAKQPLDSLPHAEPGAAAGHNAIRDPACHPLAAAPTFLDTLTDHTLRPLAKLPPCDRRSTLETEQTKRYIFLSSSPPVEDHADEIHERDNSTTAHEAFRRKENCSANIGMTSNCRSGTVAESEAARAGPRKTLGVRRSMVGWQARNKLSLPHSVRPSRCS